MAFSRVAPSVMGFFWAKLFAVSSNAMNRKLSGLRVVMVFMVVVVVIVGRFHSKIWIIFDDSYVI